MEGVPAGAKKEAKNMTFSVNPTGNPVLDIGRDVHGRFRKGNPGGPGNPFARKVAALRKTLLESVSDQDLKDMIEVLKLKARQGNLTALKLVFQYCIGKPTAAPDPDRMDIDEWQRLQQMRVSQEQFKETEESIPACLACHMAQFGWPCTVQEGDGRVQHAIHHIHEDLQPPAPSGKRAKTSPHCVQPQPAPAPPSATAANQTEESHKPTEAPAPKAEQRSSAQGTSKPKERREQAGRSRSEGRSRTQAPLPNGENEREQLRTIELLQRAFQPPQPSQQPQSKPPKG
jgi:hypothetical protein